MPTDTISADLTPASGAGYTYGSDNLTVTVVLDVIVRSEDNNGIFSNRFSSALVNNGSIIGSSAAHAFSGQQYGVYLQSGNSITNNWSIEGGIGIFCDNGPVTIVNKGWIAGNSDSGVWLRSLSGTDVLNNYGTIFGVDSGIYAFTMGSSSSSATHRYNNHGFIQSDAVGIQVQGQRDFLVAIVNLASAVIRAPEAVLTVNFGHVNVTNSGLIDGTLECTAANASDKVVNKATIKGAVLLGPGSDTYDGSGGGTVTGAIHGGTGADQLTAGLGRDVMFGDTQADKFLFKSVLHSPAGAKHDRIMDFSHGQGDKINVFGIDANANIGGNQSFTFINAQPFHHKAGELHYVTASGHVIVEGDVNGDGKADLQFEVHNLANNLSALSPSDFVL